MKKIISYLGFAKKSHSCITGQTALKKNKKQLYVVLTDDSASENLKNLAKNLAAKHGCKYFVCPTNLEELINQPNIKILGLTDENLSQAIIDNMDRVIKEN